MIRDVLQRSASSAEQEIRAYKAPTVNTSAQNFRELILPAIMKCGGDLEPPYTRALSDTELANFKQPASSDRSAAAHAVDRTGCQTDNEAASAVSGTDCQDGAALSKRAFRSQHSAPRARHKKKWRQE